MAFIYRRFLLFERMKNCLAFGVQNLIDTMQVKLSESSTVHDLIYDIGPGSTVQSAFPKSKGPQGESVPVYEIQEFACVCVDPSEACTSQTWPCTLEA
jgi:hypothetical protein